MTPFRRALLNDIIAYPGEYAPRRIVFGSVCVAEVPPSVGTNPPAEEDWAKRMREDGLILPAKVRCSAHMTAARVARMPQGTAREIVGMVFETQGGGLPVGEISRRLNGEEYPSGALERVLEELYRDGRLSPPAALWASERGRALCQS